ncbi:MAG: TIGR00366 family protein [Thermaerobacter sp.]|nr:TIGR00366 family protein [Thermaerobacter sp.]
MATPMPTQKRGVLERFGDSSARIIRLYMPDAYILAVLLTFVTFILALIFTKTPFVTMTADWFTGLWAILEFSFQMILILLTGYALAQAPSVQRFIRWLASLAKTQAQAVVLAALVGALGSFINWALGLILMGMIAREIAKRVEIHFPYLVAAAYSGFLVWASGIASSVAIISATPGNSVNFVQLYTHHILPESQTVFAWWNLLASLIIIVMLPILFRVMLPKDRSKWLIVDREALRKADDAAKQIPLDDVPVSKLDNSWVLTVLIVGIGLVYLISTWSTKGFVLDFDTLIFLFLIVGMLLHWRPMSYLNSFYGAARTAGPLALQYPFYGGMMTLMISTGLASVMAGWFVAISSTHTLPFWQFIASVVINLFIPSGGGHWAVQGSVATLSAVKLHASMPLTTMGVAWGEQVMEMLQPFWMLPVLAIAGAKVRDVLGYGAAAFVLGLVVYGGMLLIVH